MSSMSNYEFDYETSRTVYYKLVTRQPTSRLKLAHLNRSRFNDVVTNLLFCEEQASKGKDCKSVKSNHVCYKQFELLRENENIFLIKCRKLKDDPILKHLIIEDSFDVISKIHLENNHCGKERLKNKVKEKYEVCNIYIDLFMKSCNVCCPKIVSSNETPTENPIDMQPRYFMINFLNMYPCMDGDFTFVLIVKEMSTDFVFLRPLLNENPDEVTVELLKIIMTFGSPSLKIQTRSNKVPIMNSIVTLMKHFGLEHDVSITCSDSECDVVASTIKEKINDWMNETDSKNWGIGCHIVQWNLNTKKENRDKPAYVRMFHQGPRILDAEQNLSSDVDCTETVIVDSDEDENPSESEIDKSVKFTEALIQDYATSDEDIDLNSSDS